MARHCVVSCYYAAGLLLFIYLSTAKFATRRLSHKCFYFVFDFTLITLMALNGVQRGVCIIISLCIIIVFTLVTCRLCIGPFTRQLRSYYLRLVQRGIFPGSVALCWLFSGCVYSRVRACTSVYERVRTQLNARFQFSCFTPYL